MQLTLTCSPRLIAPNISYLQAAIVAATSLVRLPTCCTAQNSVAGSLTFQRRWTFIARTEISYVCIGDVTRGLSFGSNLGTRDQVRGLLEKAIIF
jgi:hypothetical protein